MINVLKSMQERIEKDNEIKLTEVEIAYLESIRTSDDIGNFDHDNEQMLALAYDAALALGLSKTQALIATGEIPAEHATVIKLHYHDGEYLSGYELYSDQAKMMEQIGLAKYVSGWGYHVDDAVVQKLGTEFEFRAAWEFAQPAIRAKHEEKLANEQAIAAIFAKAKRTGKGQVLKSYSDECNDPREECSLDTVTVYAMPDGSRKTVRNHTW